MICPVSTAVRPYSEERIMRIIQKLAAVVALSIAITSPAFAEKVLVLGDLQGEQQQIPPVNGAHIAPSQATQSSQGCSVSLAGSEPEYTGCTRSQIEGFSGGRVAQATPAPAAAPTPAKCTPVISDGELTFEGRCSARQISSVRARLTQGTEAADPMDRAVKTMNQVENRRFVQNVLGNILGAATDRVFYGRSYGGSYGRGGYNSYDRGGGNTRGSGATWNCQPGQYCP